ncbi:MAG: alpha-glucosidase, partial [Chloroflexota bacterium]
FNTFYQIYPRSFADANGDGIGDIQGIISKLDYLHWLGIKGIWLSPHYPSPQVDVGYDIADYTAVEPDYGTMDDFQQMLDEIHKRDMKLILDLVLNHTSDKHQWFQESKSSRDNPKRDWYVWHDGVDGAPPNNWESQFGGSAWTYDETTDQYYYHYFLKEQPDLNWRNPEVKQAMFDATRFWLDMGVDGFRLDAIGTIYEDPTLTPHTSTFNAIDSLRIFWIHDEEKPEASWAELVGDLFKYQSDLPEIFDLIRDFRSIINEYEDRFLVGESSDVRYLGDGTSHLQSIFNFDLTFQPTLTASLVRDTHEDWRKKIPAGTWVSNTLNNHDQSRVATHFASHDSRMTHIAVAIPLFLEGIPFLYYGEEIGMEDYAIRSLDELRDMAGAVYRQVRLLDEVSEAQILKELGKFSRDRCRTPMQWNNTANAGFSPENVTTWLPVHENHTQGINVASQENDEQSLLHLYRDLIHLRNQHIALQVGTFRDIDPDNGSALIFLREADEQTCLVALSFSPESQDLSYDLSGTVLYSTAERVSTFDGTELTLAPFEVLVVELS